MENNNIDSCKFLFRTIRDFKNLTNSGVYFHIGYNPKIVYEENNIRALNRKIFGFWGNTWNRLVRANIYTKAILSLNEILLNIHKNIKDDVWLDEILHKVSYSYTIFERVGYVYLQKEYEEKNAQNQTDEQLSEDIKEQVGTLSFQYCLNEGKENKYSIIKKLKDYNEVLYDLNLQNFIAHFEVLNNLLEALIKDKDIDEDNRDFCDQLLKESKKREKDIKENK